MKEINPEEEYRKISYGCSLRETCRKDVQTKLERRGADAKTIEDILTRLEKDGFIDENRYARAFVHDKYLFDKWGRLKIRNSLRLKGISQGDINDALQQINEEIYLDNLKSIVENKRLTTKADTSFALSQKLLRFATSRGYEPRLVFPFLELELEE